MLSLGRKVRVSGGNMALGLHEIFTEVLSFLFIGQLLRKTLFPKQEQQRVVARVVIQVVLPALLFRTLMRSPRFTLDGIVLASSWIIFFSLEFVAALAIFGRRELSLRPQLITCCLGQNV